MRPKLITLVLMVRPIALMLAVQLLLHGTIGAGLEQLLGLGGLADHYNEHVALAPELGLMEFVWMHYADPEHEQSDPMHHGRLPFHSSASQPVLITPEHPDHVMFSAPDWLASVSFVVHDQLPTALNVHGIFHPPKAIG